MGKTKSFTKENDDHKRPIIVYGASVYGEIAFYALRALDIQPDYFCDQAQEKHNYYGIPVIHPDKLMDMLDANIIIASADYFAEIKELLEKKGCLHLFDMAELLNVELSEEQLSNRAKEMYANKQHYIDVVHNWVSDEGLAINRVQFVVSERCSLKCKDCTHLMQYYQHPKDIELEQYKPAFDKLLEAVSVIGELRILGGEPFINQEMDKVIHWYHDQDKIQSISIYTNGTIIPSGRMLQSLQRKKVKVHISNYGLNQEKVLQLVDCLEKYKINYFERVYDTWQDAGDLRFRDYTKEHMKKIFSQCFERNCITFLKGQLHRCPRSAHAMNIGAMPIVKEDFIDLLHWDAGKEELMEQIKLLVNKPYIEACNYCDGLNNHMQNIQPAIQIKRPLQYEKIGETP